MDPIIIGAIGLGILAVAALGLALRNRDTSTAIGQLSGETVKRDRKVEVPEADTAAVTGKQLEAVGSARGRAALVAAESAPPVAYVPPDPDTIGVARRQFLNRGILGMFALGLGGFGAACIGFLWPQGVSGFGSKVTVGRVPDIQAAIVAGGGFLYVPEGRMWVAEFPAAAVEKASEQYGFYDQVSQGLTAGVTALYQTCPHLGCRVPECLTSQWFECPCHGSQYNQVGGKKGGPAPRGMDRFAMQVNADQTFTVKTGTIVNGPPIGTNTTGQESEGAHCIGSSDDH